MGSEPKVTPTDREMLREKLRVIASSTKTCYVGCSVKLADAILDYLDAGYEPLRKKEPLYLVQICSSKAFVIHRIWGNAAEFNFDRCPNAEAEARALAEKLNAAERKEK